MTENNIKILAIIVLYKTALNQSLTFLSLMSLSPDIRSQISLIVYENSTSVEDSKSLLFKHKLGNFEHVCSLENGGVAQAYNYALQRANDQQIAWMLLLDQDTQLTRDYFNEILNFIAEPKSVIAFLPQVAYGQRIFTPVMGLLRNAKAIFGQYSISKANYLSTINSGLLLSVAFINSLGGFDSRFWLDGLDHWLFCMMLKKNSQVFVGNSILQHNLSVNSKEYVSFSRYVNILNSEKLLYLEFWTFSQRLLYLLTLLYRAIKLVLKTRGFKYSIRTVAQIFFCMGRTK